MSKFIFDGKLFKIRESLDSDVNLWYKWFNDPSITKYLLHGVYPNTLEKQRKFRRDNVIGEKKIIFSILDNRGIKLIGTCSINIFEPFNSRRCEISLIIGNKKFHKGNLYLNLNIWLINYSFKQLGMNSILAACFEENLTVVKTLEILGFKKIGLERARFFKNDSFHNILKYDLLKNEWKF